jgi:hypothetical protein
VGYLPGTGVQETITQDRRAGVAQASREETAANATVVNASYRAIGLSGYGDLALAWCLGLLHHSVGKMAPHRVRRHAHSLKRDISPAAANRHADSPLSMTSPRTTLTRGHYAPLPNRSSAVPAPLCQNNSTQCFFGAICGVGLITTLIPRWTRLPLHMATPS